MTDRHADAISFDYEALWRECRAYLRKKQIYDEDLLSEMIVLALEQVERDSSKPLIYKYLFLSAYNRLHPKVQINYKQLRKESFVMSWEDLERAPDPVANKAFSIEDIPYRLPTSGPVRAMIILSVVYGYTQQELAHLFGATQSDVSKFLRQTWLPKYLDDDIDDLRFDDLRIPVQWTTIL